METTKLKFRLIYRPFLITLSLFVGIYTLLNWLLCVKLSVQLHEEITDILLPAFILGLLVYFLIRPRLDVLIFKNSRQYSNYLLAFFLALFIPVFTAQKSISKITGGLLEIHDISEIDKDNPAKYYRINDFSVDKETVGCNIKFIERNRRRDLFYGEISMTIFVVAPMYSSTTEKEESRVMYCKSYDRDIDYNQSEESKQRECERFEKDALSQFVHNDKKPVIYFERISETSSDYAYVYKAVKELGGESSDYIFLSPQTKPFDKRYNNWVLAFGISLLVVLLVTWFMISIKDLDKSKVESYINRK